MTHYDRLHVTRTASVPVIRAAYKVLAQQYHPDKNPGVDTTRVMKALNEAYEVLSTAEGREKYDAQLDVQPIRVLAQKWVLPRWLLTLFLALAGYSGLLTLGVRVLH